MKFKTTPPENIVPGTIILTSALFKKIHHIIPGYFSHGALYVGRGLHNLLLDFFDDTKTILIFYKLNLHLKYKSVSDFINLYDNETEYVLQSDITSMDFIPYSDFLLKYNIFAFLTLDKFVTEAENHLIMKLVADYSLINIFKKYYFDLEKTINYEYGYCFKIVHDVYYVVLTKLNFDFQIAFEKTQIGGKTLEYILAKNILNCKDLKLYHLMLSN